MVRTRAVRKVLYSGKEYWYSGRKLSKKRVFSILLMPSSLHNQRAYAGLVLIKHYNNLSYYRISLGAL